MHLERADGGHNDDGIRREPALAALDVQELFRTQVKGESGLRHGVLAAGQGHARGQHGVAAVRDVGERTAVHERRHALQALHQVRVDGVFQDGQHGVRHAELLCVHSLVLRGEAHHDVVDAAAQVIEALRQAEARHHFGCRGDVEALLARHAVAVQSHQ